MKLRKLLKVAFFVCTIFAGEGMAAALTLQEELGGQIYRDKNLSSNYNQSCMTCHHPLAGFADPKNSMDPVNLPVSEGSIAGVYGGRNAPSSAYAGFSPILANVDGVWKGGMFWDGRATGTRLGDPLAEQAQGPFLNPREMNMTKELVVLRVSTSHYAKLFLKVYPGTDFSNIDQTYDNIAKAIAAFERSSAVTKFKSLFDLFWAACQLKGIDVSTITEVTSNLPTGILTTRQLQGLALFNGKAKCSGCHISTNQKVDGVIYPPLFTDFTFDNLGIPTNERLYELFDGGSPPDLGLGPIVSDVNQNGKFMVPTLRNVAKSPPYGHNGYFATLDRIVHFYNTRDVDSWPAPDYPYTVNHTELGNLGLTLDEEQALVAFMHTLTDQGR